jgi:protein arginine N-methyltransferase 6
LLLGILSIFSAQAGAKIVYAIEPSNLAILISQVAEENNVNDKIKVIKKSIEDLNTNEIESVDIIVSEWMGFYLVHEGMLNSVIIARDKFLKSNGLMFPKIAKLYAAPCQLPKYNEFWNDIFGVSMK